MPNASAISGWVMPPKYFITTIFAHSGWTLLQLRQGILHQQDLLVRFGIRQLLDLQIDALAGTAAFQPVFPAGMFDENAPHGP